MNNIHNSLLNTEPTHDDEPPAKLFGQDLFDFDLQNRSIDHEKVNSFSLAPEPSDAELLPSETISTCEGEAEVGLDTLDLKDGFEPWVEQQRKQLPDAPELEDIGIETLSELMKNPEIIEKYGNSNNHMVLNFFAACFSAKKRAADGEWSLKDVQDLKKDIEKCEREAGKRTTEMVRNSFMLFTRHQVQAFRKNVKKNKVNTRQRLLEDFNIDLNNFDFASTFAKEEDFNEKKLKTLAKTLLSDTSNDRSKDLASFKYLLETYKKFLEVSYEQYVCSDFSRFKDQYIANLGHLHAKKKSKVQNIRPRNLTKARHTVSFVCKIIEKVQSLL
jgi:hypothetical protein